MLLRQEAALDRSIDRKVRIILTMRQEHARLCRGGSRTAPTQLEGASADTPSSVCDSGQNGEARPSLRETQTPNVRGLRQPGNHGQKVRKRKTPAKPQNRRNKARMSIENKGPVRRDKPAGSRECKFLTRKD